MFQTQSSVVRGVHVSKPDTHPQGQVVVPAKLRLDFGCDHSVYDSPLIS